MEKYKRKFSIDTPIPYSANRRRSEPVVFSTSPSGDKGGTEARINRRYSTALNSPLANLHGRRESEPERYNKYSTNKEVRANHDIT